MQGQNHQTRLASDCFTLAHRSPYLGDARKESQDTAGVLPGIQEFYGLSRLNLKGLRGVRQMPDRQRKPLSLRSKDRTTFKVSSYRRRIERGRHHDNPNLPSRALEPLQEYQRKITVQVSLVELVENDRIDSPEGWICKQTAGQNALRDKSQSRAWSGLLFETDLIADRSSNLFAQLPCDPSCRHARCDPAWLERNNFAANETENGRWDAGGLSRARWRFDDKVGSTLQGGKYLRQNRIYRKCWLSTH
jgi:hypothetical protein